MNIFNVISLLGGLAMFLYGMRMMGDGLKESSSGTLKIAMEQVTNNPFKAFLLGVLVTAIIQSSTATIVITSGLVGAGIITLKQSLGIVIGANVGTTVTGQIIRLLDVDDSATSWLQFFKPSTLAPLALIIGMVLIMGFKFKNSSRIGTIAIGFGILFSGLMNMTGSVTSLSDSGLFENMFSRLGDNPVLGYLTGAGIAFLLQSSSATIGILQAFSMTGLLSWNAIYAVIVGIYLGDCVTTAIVCSIGAKPEAKRVGVVNILFNLSETVVVLLGVTIAHKLGLLDSLWTRTVNSGLVANTNTIFNLTCALLLFPMLPVYEKLSRKIVKNEPIAEGKYDDLLEALSPAFFSTPALALRSCYNALMAMYEAARTNIEKAMNLLHVYDEKVVEDIMEEEDNIDTITDEISNYLVALSPHIKEDYQVRILNEYYKVVTEFERLGDHAVNIAEMSQDLDRKGLKFSDDAIREIDILEDLIYRILDLTRQAFEKRDVDAAMQIEPLEEVTDDMVNALHDLHLERLRKGQCSVDVGSSFLNLLSDLERISDVCSNVGVETLTRVNVELESKAHEFISSLHSGHDETFNQRYDEAHKEFFGRLDNKEQPAAK
ncbi:MAG: Na/Pi cotransporter family protein [Firmicutes bacterium]|nr:Na/Pi cotransporter family protein [Bacillota bacterium]